MRIKAPLILLVISAISIILVNASCKKVTTLTTGGTLRFSVDTVKFDTVFTSAGSFTYYFVIYNPQNEAVTISSVQMQNGTASYFHLNVDGFPANPGRAATNLKIAPHDSIYVFATVKIDSDRSLTPFYITDAMVATLNGKQYTVPFTAYGQNAHYIVSDSLGLGNFTWLTDKPYVVIHTLVVGPTATFTIPADCKVYLHQDARIIVYQNASIWPNPSFFINPAQTDSVVLQGDRLDRAYFGYTGYPGEWCGIWFLPGSVGVISHAILKNCGGGTSYYNYFTQAAAIEVDTLAQLRIDHSIIENSISLGLLSYSGSVTATSCLVNTTGGQALAITQGGFDSITNCTFANYGTSLVNHANAGTVAILNYFSPDGKTYYFGALNAVMRNCIVYGSLDSEIVCDAVSNAPARLLLDHCLLKMGNIHESFVSFNSPIFNTDPKFKNSGTGDFHLADSSRALGAGTSSFTTGLTDLDGNSFGDSVAIGCYKR